MSRKVSIKSAIGVMLFMAIALTGCGGLKAPTTDMDRLQGAWTGKSINDGSQWAMVIIGNTMECQGPGQQSYGGTIILDETTVPKSGVLTITKCAAEQYVGKKANYIYKFEDGKLVMAGTEPGSGTKPTGFTGDNGVVAIEFTKMVDKSKK
ncbi:MAG: hypothetical protein JEZ07_00890 [Phycisphaerae bacterium]|nr:hypothetical protein [Phycisphaerae bacterium]